MHTVINKLGLFPEWNNYTEADKNLTQSEELFIKSLDPIKSFEGSNQNIYQFPNFQIISNQLEELTNVMENGNQAIACQSSDLKNLESIYNKFQTKKLDKLKFDNSYKRSLKKSENIQNLIQNHQENLIEFELIEENKPEQGSRQEKFDQEFNEYQKTFIQSFTNIFSELASTKMRTATKVAEIGSLLEEKASSVEIFHNETLDELNQEMKKLKKVVKNNDKILNNEKTVDAFDNDDEFVIVQDQKGVIELSDGEYYEYEEEDVQIPEEPPQPVPKVQVVKPQNDENMNKLAQMLYDEDEVINMPNNDPEPEKTSNLQDDVKLIASNFLIPEDEPVSTNATPAPSSKPTNNTQTKSKRRHRRGKKGKH